MNRAVARTMQRLHRGDDGFSLPELMVTIFVMGVLGAIVVSFYVGMTGAFTEDRASTDSTSTASIGMNNVTRVIRSGTEVRVRNQPLNDPVFLIARDDDIALHSFIDTDSDDPRPVVIRFNLNDRSELLESRWSCTVGAEGYFTCPDWDDIEDDSVPPESRRVIARTVLEPQGAEPTLFTYLAAEGAEISLPQDVLPAANVRRTIASVQVRLTVQADSTGTAPPVSLQSTVGIPNLGISRIGP